MKNKRMIIALKPRSMGKLAGLDLFLSEYLQQGLSGGGDFQITMDYKEGDGLTMQLVKGDKKLKETHIRREPLDIAAKVLHHAARFTMEAQRRNENPSILLAQDTGVWVSKDSIEVEAVSLDTQVVYERYRKGSRMGPAGNRKEDGIAMADEEREKKIVDEKKARADAVAILCRALQAAGVPLLSLKIIEDGSDRMVKATFEWGERWANISMDAPHTALWDILRQIPELR